MSDDAARWLEEQLRARSPVAAAGAALDDELALGAGGLGLDSIAVVELLLACEERLGRGELAAWLAEENAPLTVGALRERLRRAA
jgi:acyl carrier protein